MLSCFVRCRTRIPVGLCICGRLTKRDRECRSPILNSTIIGVLPQGFTYSDQQYDIFVPLGLNAGETWAHLRSEHNGIYCVARLKPGVSLQQAQADLDTIAAALEQQYPTTNKFVSVNALPL